MRLSCGCSVNCLDKQDIKLWTRLSEKESENLSRLKSKNAANHQKRPKLDQFEDKNGAEKHQKRAKLDLNKSTRNKENQHKGEISDNDRGKKRKVESGGTLISRKHFLSVAHAFYELDDDSK